MVLEQVYLFFIYILFLELVIAVSIATALFIALVVIIRKIDKQKDTSLLGR